MIERISQGTPEVSDYGYDTRGRLDLVTRAGQVADYGYDSNGNRTAAPNLLASATYDEQDRLREYGGITYGYSDDGEVTSRTESGQTTLFEYDALGSLRSVQRPGEPIIEYVNDGLGRRVGKKVSGVLARGWLYDDRLRIVAEVDGTNAVVSRFVYGTRINVPDYGVIQGQMFRFITDHLGSVRLVVDAASGTIAQRIDYDEFGNAVLVAGSWGMHPFGFAGGLADADTGLVRFGSRDYDASVGRWMARDPSLFRGSKTNLYEYVSSDPVNFFDPFGATQCDVDVAIDVCKRANPDRDYPADIQADLHDPPDEDGKYKDGLYIYIPLIWEDISLNDMYLGPLDDAGARRLLTTLLHELIHANDPWYKNLNDLFDPDHPDVNSKAKEEAKRLLEQYLAERAAECRGQ